jgi:alanine racemase
VTRNDITRWAWAEIDLDAYRHNVRVLRDMVAPSEVWTVVKANAYGHGAVPIARAALEAGATGLCVALTDEGVELRDAGITAPILVFTEQPAEELHTLVHHGITPSVYRTDHVDALAGAVRAAGRTDVDVHVKVDTGMHRSGAEPADVPEVIECIRRHAPLLRLAGIFTHYAAADEPGHPANVEQPRRFDELLSALGDLGPEVMVHAVNSAGALALPDQRRSLVRPGIATYGISPGPQIDQLVGDLRPVMSLKARVSRVHVAAAGDGVSYGHRRVVARPTVVATLPIGYADGVSRRLWNTGPDESGIEVLIGGRRCPILGVVTMDQVMVDCGAPGETDVAVGDVAVLIGRQGSEQVRAEDWARALGTIGYEVTCAIGSRIPRIFLP